MRSFCVALGPFLAACVGHSAVVIDGEPPAKRPGAHDAGADVSELEPRFDAGGSTIDAKTEAEAAHPACPPKVDGYDSTNETCFPMTPTSTGCGSCGLGAHAVACSNGGAPPVLGCAEPGAFVGTIAAGIYCCAKPACVDVPNSVGSCTSVDGGRGRLIRCHVEAGLPVGCRVYGVDQGINVLCCP